MLGVDDVVVALFAVGRGAVFQVGLLVNDILIKVGISNVIFLIQKVCMFKMNILLLLFSLVEYDGLRTNSDNS